MKTLIAILIIILFFGAVFFVSKGRFMQKSHQETPLQSNNYIEKKMRLTSFAFEHNGKMPAKYTCDGENINPPLNISDIPADAKSLALIMDDPDAVKPAEKV